MTVQVAHAYGGHLPRVAPTTLPPGVLHLDGWADRLIVVANCLWVAAAARYATALARHLDGPPAVRSPSPRRSWAPPRSSSRDDDEKGEPTHDAVHDRRLPGGRPCRPPRRARAPARPDPRRRTAGHRGDQLRPASIPAGVALPGG